MAAQLSASGLAAGDGPSPLFADLDLVVAPGEVVGVVGPNGAGKTTLLRLLADLDRPRTGAVSRSPADSLVGWLPQETERRTGETVVGHIARRSGVTDAHERLAAAADALASGRPGAEAAYAAELDRWTSSGAPDLEHRVPAALERVGLGPAGDVLMTSLSGGEAARVGLAVLLLSRFDVLLLDEPTNDLDLAGLEQLERFVLASDAATVLVSHDREFLRRTVDRVVELDLHQHAVHVHGGGFDTYLDERQRRRRRAREDHDVYADTVSRLQERARTQRAWATRGVRAQKRSASDGDKLLRNRRIESTEQQAATARRTERMIERLEEVPEPRREWELRFSIAGAPPSGTVVATRDGAVVERGPFRHGPVTLQVDRGDRVAITGPNGSGKTTLLHLLCGTLEPDHGRASGGAGVVVGEVDQARETFVSDEDLLDAVVAQLPGWPTSQVRSLLAKFGLGGDHLLRPATTLSPGERTRAALALLQARGVNLLVLDEPTNHLDLPAIEQLEQAVDAFDGTVLLVSHDRRLLEGFRSSRSLELDGGRVVERT